MKQRILLSWVAATIVYSIGCGKPDGPPPQYPPRAEGCAVQLFHGAPSMPTENLGPVMAKCDDTVSEKDCERTLLDQACKLGGDVVWSVSEKPEMKNGKQVIHGRAAHSKAGP